MRAFVAWSRDESKTPVVESTIERLAPSGEERWSVRHVRPPRGYANAWRMAFDDGGRLYALAAGRVGDGVSGGDVSSGGAAIYDAEGVLVAALDDDDVIPGDVKGLARGAVLSGMKQRIYDDSGKLLRLYGEERYRAPTRELGGLGVRVVESPGPGADILLERGRGSYLRPNAAFDADGHAYFVHGATSYRSTTGSSSAGRSAIRRRAGASSPSAPTGCCSSRATVADGGLERGRRVEHGAHPVPIRGAIGAFGPLPLGPNGVSEGAFGEHASSCATPSAARAGRTS